MAITRRPKAVIHTEANPGVDVDALINKGGSVAQPVKTSPTTEAIARVILRVPAEVLAQIDEVVEARRVKMPRHTWLLEALVEKLEREVKASD